MFIKINKQNNMTKTITILGRNVYILHWDHWSATVKVECGQTEVWVGPSITRTRN